MAMILNFGSYPQKSRVKEPIEWLVLDVKGDEALLVSHYALDCRQYHCRIADVTWEDCDLRKWLNDGFLKAAFSAEEQEKILLSEVVNDDNRKYGTSGGNSTRDWVFCLSLTEAERYFKDNTERRCRPTALAEAHGAAVSDHFCCWWLRSPGARMRFEPGYRAATAYADGEVNPYGFNLRNGNLAVRPALWVKL